MTRILIVGLVATLMVGCADESGRQTGRTTVRMAPTDTRTYPAPDRKDPDILIPPRKTTEPKS